MLVLEGDTSAVHPLPHTGTVLIGRSPEAGIALVDQSVSRQHAEVVLKEGEARLVDLGSHNGVRLNGEQVTSSQVLRNRDVVMLGDVTLVFHCGERPQPARSLLDAAALHARLAEELERVRCYERPLSVLALEPGAGGASAQELVAAASHALSPLYFAGQAGASLVVLLPELSSEDASAVGKELLESLESLAPEARAGIASAPRDGLKAEVLLTNARAAALAAPPHGLRASDARPVLKLGTRQVVVADPAMVHLYELLKRLALSDIPVLIHGETGSGKEHAAWALHHWSQRSTRPFVPVNCAALPDSLVDSALFGHEKGAFTGADKAHAGLFEEATGGTLFLDEVADLPPATQAKLLRVLEERKIRRIGGSRDLDIHVRVVAATHRVLADEVKAGRFRADLFFRLGATVVMLPPLRDRPAELPFLINFFLASACVPLGRSPPQLSAAAMSELSAYPWPGNVRELKNAMDHVAAVAQGSIAEVSDLPRQISLVGQAPPADDAAQPPPSPATRESRGFRPIGEELRELERLRMCEALAATEGVQARAARLLSMPLRTFALKMKRYELSARDWQAAP